MQTGLKTTGHVYAVKAPEPIRHFPDGTPVCNLLVSAGYSKEDGGTTKEFKNFARLQITGANQVNLVQDFVTIGSKLYFEGRLKVDPNTGAPPIYANKDGYAAVSHEYTVFHINTLNSKAETDALREKHADKLNGTGNGALLPPPPSEPVAPEANSEDEIPF